MSISDCTKYMILLRVYPKYTGYSRTSAKLSNDILIGMIDKGKTLVTIHCKLIVLLKVIVYEKRL